MKLQEMDIDGVMEMAQDTVKQHGDHVPTFILCREDGELMIVAAQFDDNNKEDFKKHLKELIDEHKVTRYAQIVTAWMATSADIKAGIREEVQKVKSPEQLQDMLERVARMTQRPSENPLKKEILGVFWFEKCGNWDQRVIEINRTENGAPIFGDAVDLSGGDAYQFNYWNVWGSHMYDLRDEDGEQ